MIDIKTVITGICEKPENISFIQPILLPHVNAFDNRTCIDICYVDVGEGFTEEYFHVKEIKGKHADFYFKTKTVNDINIELLDLFNSFRLMVKSINSEG